MKNNQEPRIVLGVKETIKNLNLVATFRLLWSADLFKLIIIYTYSIKYCLYTRQLILL